jgi:sporulation protein YlmC with PRC-barrel domain
MRSHDDAPVEPLMRLSRMPDYGVERHEPDPRGWTVANGRGKKVGEVKDLIVDTHSMTARYLDVELDTKVFDWRGNDPHILVPVDRAHIDGKHLVVSELTETWAAELRTHLHAQQQAFWEQWWRRSDRRPGAGLSARVARLHPDELNRVINDVRPGETVRIPVVNEEIVVERRPATDESPRERVVVNRAADEPPPPRRQS